MLAHVASFGRNPRGSPDFLAYPIPKACMHVLGTGVRRCLGVARSPSSLKAALPLGCSSAPGLRIFFCRVTCMARAASVPRLWTPCFLLLCGACILVSVVIGLWPRLRPATPGWGVGVCVCLCAPSACTLLILAGVRAVGVCAWDLVSAATCHSWVGCWGVCVLVCELRLYSAIPGCEVWVCVLRLGFPLRPATRGCGVWVCAGLSQEWWGAAETRAQIHTHTPHTPARSGGVQAERGHQHTRTPTPQAGVAGRSRNPSPNTHTHTAHPSQEWQGTSGARTPAHTHPNTPARSGGAQPFPEPKHTHARRTPQPGVTGYKGSTHTNTHTPTPQPGVAGRSRNPSPNTHTRTADPSQCWRGTRGAPTPAHTHPNTQARSGG